MINSGLSAYSGTCAQSPLRRESCIFNTRSASYLIHADRGTALAADVPEVREHHPTCRCVCHLVCIDRDKVASLWITNSLAPLTRDATEPLRSSSGRNVSEKARGCRRGRGTWSTLQTGRNGWLWTEWRRRRPCQQRTAAAATSAAKRDRSSPVLSSSPHVSLQHSFSPAQQRALSPFSLFSQSGRGPAADVQTAKADGCGQRLRGGEEWWRLQRPEQLRAGAATAFFGEDVRRGWIDPRRRFARDGRMARRTCISFIRPLFGFCKRE